jgi:hypothetical protein
MKHEKDNRELKNQASAIIRRRREEAIESWQKMLEIGRIIAESEPGAESAVTILTEMREEENQ